ncbi:hypothetical protein RHSIM_Rhsim03G0032500 [Rhododendron simsii]|uniref:Uncharacterized protein n=1 Tax=Rhododendron simsii TaxID=118357 RepID=A0A834H741_RHOSS|nr:hypothetical protein RHSIM_Rhsim03G0032500 [Rhododendron simsii]
MESFAFGTRRRSFDEERSSSSTNNTQGPAAITANDASEAVINVATEKRRMEKVPLTIREDEKTKGHFDPRVVSVGPYHHGKEKLEMAERIKPIVAQLFVSSSGRDMAEFRRKALEIVDDARNYYLEGSTNKYSDEEFAEMILLDGLLVLAIFESITSNDREWGGTIPDVFKKHLGAHATYLVFTDILFLLENQLPFHVLESLMSLKSDGSELLETMDKIWDLVKSRGSSRKYKKKLDNKRTSRKKPLHTLEYFWLEVNGLNQPNHPLKTNTPSIDRNLVKPDYMGSSYSFRSISELKAKGIHARRSTSYPSRAFSFKSFFFFGVLEIPLLILDPQFIVYISNQVAFESTPNNVNNLPTMVYINLMKSLINSPEDVKELRSRNILFSTYNSVSDEEVVKLLSSITTFGMEDFRIYDEVKERIQEHYNSKAKTWIAELIHNYFSSPWTFIAFFATTSLVVLSFLQTFFTMFPPKCK